MKGLCAVTAEDSYSAHRRLRRCVEVMRGLGMAATALGLFYGMSMFLAQWWLLRLIALVPIGFGITQFLLASSMKRRHRWAITASIVVAVIQTALGAFLMFALVMSAGVIDVARGKRMGVTIALAILTLVLVLLGRLIADLFASYEALRFDPPPTGPRGFEAIPMATAAPDSVDRRDQAMVSFRGK